jgi:hypothetical protein
MRIAGLLFLGCISLLSISAAPPVGDKPKAEVNWARRVVLDLVEECQKARHVSSSAARGLLSPEFADSMRAADAATNWTVLDDLGCSSHNPKLTSEEVAPNGSEVIFTYSLTFDGPGRGDIKGDAIVTFRVAKDSENGKWCVRFIHIKKPESKNK